MSENSGKSNGEKVIMGKVLSVVMALLITICMALITYSLNSTVNNAVAIGKLPEEFPPQWFADKVIADKREVLDRIARVEGNIEGIDKKLDKLIAALSKAQPK